MNEAVYEGLVGVLLSEAFTRYEKEYLNSLPSEDELSERYPITEKELRSVEKYRRRSEKIKKYGRPLAAVYLRRAVAVLLITVSLAFGAMMLNGEVRAAVVNAIVQTFDKFLSISFNNDSAQSDENLNIYDFDVLSNIPDGYELVKEREDGHQRYYEFKNENNVMLCVIVAYTDGTSIGLDNEHSTFEEIEIDGNEAYKSINNSTVPNFVDVVVIKGNVVLDVNGFANEETIIAIAEAIIK